MKKEFNVNLFDLSIAYAVITYDEDVMISHANDVFYASLGFDIREIELKNGARLSALIPVAEFLQIQEFLKSDKQHIEIELPFKGKNQTTIYFLAYIVKAEHDEHKSFMVCTDIQSYKASERHLEDITMLMHQVLEYEKLGILLFESDSRLIKYCNTSHFLLQSGCVNHMFPDVFIKENTIDPLYVDKINDAVDLIADFPLDKNIIIEFRAKNLENEYVWICMSLSKHLYRGHVEVLCILSDINGDKEATKQYIEQSLFYQSLLNSKDAYGQIDVTDDKFMRMGGLWNLYNELTDKMTYTELFHSFIEKVVHPEDRKHYIEVMECKNLEDSFANGITTLGCEFRRIVDQNKMSWMKITIHLSINPLNRHLAALMYIENIDDIKHQHQIEIAAVQTDQLTSLYTKKTIIEQVTDYLNEMSDKEACAFIHCDIDHMEHINETYGYSGGDTVLVNVSDILSTVFRRRDILGRYERDRFIIVLKDIAEGGLENRIDTLFRMIEENKITPYTVSLGIVYASQGDTYVNCFKQSCLALAYAKTNQGNTYKIFNEELLTKANESIKLDAQESFMLQLDHDEDNHSQLDSFDKLVGDQGDIAYLVHPKTYELLLGNQVFYERLGITVDECKGRTCYDIIHNRELPCPYCQKTNWTTDKYYMYRNYNEVLEQEFLIKNKLVTWKGNISLLALAVDLSNDKSVVDSMKSDMPEEKYILGGVQNMQNANSLDDVIHAALETITMYFRADVTRIWPIENDKETMDANPVYYAMAKADDELKVYNDLDIKTVKAWLSNHRWQDRIMFENQETVMMQSFDLYQMLQQKHIENQMWFSLQDDDREYGVIEINNIHANLQNISFMKNFAAFIINEWKKCQMVESITYNVNYDPLTGLSNRTSYDAYFQNYDADSFDSIAVVVVDVNGLSKINSSLGSKVGDSYLKMLGEIMKEVFSDAKNYRLGSDEFQILWSNIDLETLERKIQLLRDKVRERNEFSVSVGYSWDGVEKKLKTLVGFATQSMLVDKKQQRDRMGELENIDHYKMQSDLITSIEKGDFLVYLQPKVNVKTGNVVGAEALIRYQDKDKNIIPPSEYIPKYEKNGLIRYIDLFVYEEVCKLVKEWLTTYGKCPVISLNFSRLTMMEHNLIEMMDSIIDKYEIPKKYIEIEITESYADVGKTLLYQSAKRIHEASFMVALDDFGTEFTNLSILSDIHVDVLKIDKSLIHSMTQQKKNITVLKHIIDMCNELHISVIAEGVENMEQRSKLMELGCYIIQGYLFSRPIDIPSFEKAFLPRVE